MPTQLGRDGAGSPGCASSASAASLELFICPEKVTTSAQASTFDCKKKGGRECQRY